LFVGALIHELFRTQQIDLDYLIRYTNAPWLVIDAPGTAEDGLFARDAEGNPLAWSRDAGLVGQREGRGPLRGADRRAGPARWPPRKAGVRADGGTLPGR
jgi:hypothetical protein